MASIKEIITQLNDNEKFMDKLDEIIYSSSLTSLEVTGIISETAIANTLTLKRGTPEFTIFMDAIDKVRDYAALQTRPRLLKEAMEYIEE